MIEKKYFTQSNVIYNQNSEFYFKIKSGIVQA